MHTSLYVAAIIGIVFQQAFAVIKLRRQHQVSLGSDSHPDLEKAIRAHANTTEYMPLALLGLASAEYGGSHWLLIHVIGIALVLGRYWHYQGITKSTIPLRVRGMYLTFYPLITIAILNLWVWITRGLLG